MAERVHEALIKTHLGESLIGHLCRDGTAIEARERPVSAPAAAEGLPLGEAPSSPPPKTTKRGRHRKGEARPAGAESPIQRQRGQRQRGQRLAQMLEEIPTRLRSWHPVQRPGLRDQLERLQAASGHRRGVPIAAILSSASTHDSRAAIPLSLKSAARVTSRNDLMVAAYCSFDLQEPCRSLNHVPLIDHNPRGGEKEPFEPADTQRDQIRTGDTHRRYAPVIRTGAERANARLKDEFGGR